MGAAELPAASSELSSEQRDTIRSTLHSVLESSHFSKSKRYPALLEFVVRTALEQSPEVPKERTVGMRVFGRPGDYDTSSDPVVRIAAGEVRRRLALFFSENPQTPVRIELPAGSYKAEFHFRPTPPAESAHAPIAPAPFLDEASSAAASAAEPNPDEIRATLVPTSPVAPSRTRILTRTHVILAAGLLVLLLAAAAGFWRYRRERSGENFLSPLLQADQTVQVLVGSSKSAEGITAKNRQEEEAYGPAGPPHLVLDDAIVAAQVCGAIRQYGRDCDIVPGKPANVEDMHGKPIIVIGGFNNPWTNLLLAPLRYTIGIDHATGHRSIIEHTPNGDVDLKSIDEKSTTPISKDYAIVARFHTDLTDSMATAIAGLGIPGTRIAGEYATSPEQAAAILSRAPKGWTGVNVEAVLEVDLVNGTASHARVIATEFW